MVESSVKHNSYKLTDMDMKARTIVLVTYYMSSVYNVLYTEFDLLQLYGGTYLQE